MKITYLINLVLLMISLSCKSKTIHDIDGCWEVSEIKTIDYSGDDGSRLKNLSVFGVTSWYESIGKSFCFNSETNQVKTNILEEFNDNFRVSIIYKLEKDTEYSSNLVFYILIDEKKEISFEVQVFISEKEMIWIIDSLEQVTLVYKN
jgi:hypothetical protein